MIEVWLTLIIFSLYTYKRCVDKLSKLVGEEARYCVVVTTLLIWNNITVGITITLCHYIRVYIGY